MTLYDVCNDYSLDVAENQNIPDNTYKAVPKSTGTSYYHKEYRELHYFLEQDGLSGINYFSVITGDYHARNLRTNNLCNAHD